MLDEMILQRNALKKYANLYWNNMKSENPCWFCLTKILQYFILNLRQTTYTNPLGPYLRNIILLHDFIIFCLKYDYSI